MKGMARRDVGSSARGRRGASGAFVVAALSGACATVEAVGTPLYPPQVPAPGAAEVAVLTGYVRYVDEVRVASRGGTFRLLPGCHLVRTPPSWGRAEGTHGAVVVKTGEIPFALPMRAGHTYVIEVVVDPVATVMVEAELRAVERDPEGTVTRRFTPGATAAALEHCQREANAGGAAPVRAAGARRP